MQCVPIICHGPTSTPIPITEIRTGAITTVTGTLAHIVCRGGCSMRGPFAVGTVTRIIDETHTSRGIACLASIAGRRRATAITGISKHSFTVRVSAVQRMQPTFDNSTLK